MSINNLFITVFAFANFQKQNPVCNPLWLSGCETFEVWRMRL